MSEDVSVPHDQRVQLALQVEAFNDQWSRFICIFGGGHVVIPLIQKVNARHEHETQLSIRCILYPIADIAFLIFDVAKLEAATFAHFSQNVERCFDDALKKIAAFE
jgi:hypothetical protein